MALRDFTLLMVCCMVVSVSTRAYYPGKLNSLTTIVSN
jgi:hypothetical protein